VSAREKRKNTKAKQEFAPGVKVVEVGRVCVDSGQIMIADPSYEIRHEDATKHLEAVYKDLRKLPGGDIPPDPDLVKQITDKINANRTKQITAKREEATTYGEGAPVAVVSSTGFGDGIYPVYAAIADCGKLGQRVAALMVDFDLGVQRELFLKTCMAWKPMPEAGDVNAKVKKAPGAIALGGAEIFTDEGETTAYFTKTMLAGVEVRLGFHESGHSSEPPNSYSVPLFVNGDMIACDHGATWAQAMAYIFAVLSAQTAEEAAERYGELHPRFTADELVRRVRNPKWESELEESPLAKQAAA